MALDLEISADAAKLLEEVRFYQLAIDAKRNQIQFTQLQIDEFMKSLQRRKRALYEIGWKG